MKLTRYLLLLPLLSFASDKWQSFVLGKRFLVQLPAPPTEIDLKKLAPGQIPPGTRAWVLRATEGIYQVISIANPHPIALADTAGRRDFYAGVLSSVMRDDSGQLLTVTSFPTASGPGMEFKYKALRKGTSKHFIKYGRFLLVDSTGYNINFLSTDPTDTLGLTGAEQRRRFFNSITVKP